MRILSLALFVVMGLVLVSSYLLPETVPPLSVEAIDLGVDQQSVFPSLYASDTQLWLSYLDEQDSLSDHLIAKAFDGQQWSAPETAAKGSNWFVNWADFPSILALPNGDRYVHTLEKSGTDTYAYDVQLRYSPKGGPWSAPFKPYEDDSQTEHGFVRMFPLDQESLGIVWLDGRKYADSLQVDEIMLGYSTLKNGQPSTSVAYLDERVCDCCQTDAVMTEKGPVVVYRDRTEAEIRDISYVYLEDGQWSEPQSVAADHWQIAGCPVNGPAIAAKDSFVAVSWYTMANEQPEVKAAISIDYGRTFHAPIKIDQGNPLGRVDIVWGKDGKAWLSWMEDQDSTAFLYVRWLLPNGEIGTPQQIAEMDPKRASGFPRMAFWQGALYLSWTDTADGGKIRMVKMVKPDPNLFKNDFVFR